MASRRCRRVGPQRRRIVQHDAVQRGTRQDVARAPVVAVARKRDPAAVVEDQLGRARLRREAQRPLQARALRRLGVERRCLASRAGACTQAARSRSCCWTSRVCVGVAGATPMLARTLSKVTACRCGHSTMAAIASTAALQPMAMARVDQRRAQVRRSAGFDALLHACELQAFQRGHRRRSARTAGRCCLPGRRGLHRARAPASGCRTCSRACRASAAIAMHPPIPLPPMQQPLPHRRQASATAIASQGSQSSAASMPRRRRARRKRFAQDGGRAHGATRWRGPLAIQRSSTNSNAISSSSHGCRSRGDGAYTRAAGRGRVVSRPYARGCRRGSGEQLAQLLREVGVEQRGHGLRRQRRGSGASPGPSRRRAPSTSGTPFRVPPQRDHRRHVGERALRASSNTMPPAWIQSRTACGTAPGASHTRFRAVVGQRLRHRCDVWRGRGGLAAGVVCQAALRRAQVAQRRTRAEGA